MLYLSFEKGLQIIILKINFENEYETHLLLGSECTNGFCHQDIFFGFLVCREVLVYGLTLDYYSHFYVIYRVLAAGIHQGEQNPKLLSRAYLSKGGIII